MGATTACMVLSALNLIAEGQTQSVEACLQPWQDETQEGNAVFVRNLREKIQSGAVVCTW